jgi:hypothetical protein
MGQMGQVGGLGLGGSEGRRARGEGRKENPDQFSNRVFVDLINIQKTEMCMKRAREHPAPDRPLSLHHSNTPTLQHSDIPTFRHSNIPTFPPPSSTDKPPSDNERIGIPSRPAHSQEPGITFASTTGRLPGTVSGGSAVNFQMPIERCITQERSRTPHRRHPSMQWVGTAAHPFIHLSHRQILPEPASPPHGP